MISHLISDEHINSDLSFKIVSATITVMRAGIDTPVQTAFGVMKDRPALFLQLQDSTGESGFGEVWCNFPTCGAEHRQQLLNTVILPAMAGREFSDPLQCFNHLTQQFQRLAVQTGEAGPLAQCVAGIDIAVWDLLAKRLHVPLYRLLGGSEPTVAVYASGINPTGAFNTFLRCRDEGYSAFKLKIGFGDEIDYPNIERICGALEPGEQLMVDANQAWQVEEAIEKLKVLSEFPLAWLEEPVIASSTADDWLAVAGASSLPLAAGENLLAPDDFINASQSDWLDVMQPDACKWGGISGVLPIARDAIENKKRYCPHFLGGGIGLAASAHLLAAAGGDGALEIDANPNPLRKQLYAPLIDCGRTTLTDKPGLGIAASALNVLQEHVLQEQAGVSVSTIHYE